MAYDKISVDELRVTRLNPKHNALLGKFETDTKELKDFLVEDAINNQQIAISNTYLWFYNPEDRLIAYMSLLTDAIRVHGTQLGKSFVDKGVEYKTLPAIKIGRMCVHKNYTARGVGTYMMYFAMKLLLEVNEKVGCRFIMLDAKTQTKAIRFYRKFGFEILKETEKGTIPMFLDMIKFIEYYKENKKKLRPSNIIEGTSR